LSYKQHELRFQGWRGDAAAALESQDDRINVIFYAVMNDARINNQFCDSEQRWRRCRLCRPGRQFTVFYAVVSRYQQ